MAKGKVKGSADTERGEIGIGLPQIGSGLNKQKSPLTNAGGSVIDEMPNRTALLKKKSEADSSSTL